jgi:hypothetical protein
LGRRAIRRRRVTFHAIKSPQALAEHGPVVQELGFVGLGDEASVDDVEGLGGSTVFAQQFGRAPGPPAVRSRGVFGCSVCEQCSTFDLPRLSRPSTMAR